MGFFIGLMSGTSVDSVDAALVSLNNSNCTLIDIASVQYQTDLQDKLLALKSNPSIDLKDFIALDHQVGHTFAQAANKVLAQTGTHASQVVAIGSHGQTIYHKPATPHPGTLQIGDPNIIARATGIDVVADFRRADMAHGGQGAPLAPAFHQFLIGDRPDTAVVNLGGIANITLLSDPVEGFDTGPANSILDACTQRYLDKPFDLNGQWARGGTVNKSVLSSMLSDPYFSKSPPKSTGTDYFNLDWALSHNETWQVSEQNMQATLLELTAVTVANAIVASKHKIKVIFVCGGGARNQFLVERLTKLLKPATLKLLDATGVTGDAVEACTFAWLAYRHINREAGNLTTVTGASATSVLGALYPATV